MLKPTQVKVGNKAKSRQMSHHKLTGKYTKQSVRTERNRRIKLRKHLKYHPSDQQAIVALAK